MENNANMFSRSSLGSSHWQVIDTTPTRSVGYRSTSVDNNVTTREKSEKFQVKKRRGERRKRRGGWEEEEKWAVGHGADVPRLVSTFDFTRELAARDREREREREWKKAPWLAGVHRPTMATRRDQTSPLDSRTS